MAQSGAVVGELDVDVIGRDEVPDEFAQSGG
jgi:hypothetical protein